MRFKHTLTRYKYAQEGVHLMATPESGLFGILLGVCFSSAIVAAAEHC